MPKHSTWDVAIVGAGIVGLAFARSAAIRGYSVLVIERSARACGASVRNFGMVWPIGQPPGELFDTAMQSRAIWLEESAQAHIWASPCGSVHAVYADDEAELLREFATVAPGHGMPCRFLEPAAAVTAYPAVQSQGLRGVLRSESELALDPREALATLPGYFAERYGITFRFGTTITQVATGQLRAANGECFAAERIFICGGADFETLFPQVWAESGVRRCKLQMLATPPQPNGWRLGTHLAGGLTLGHYAAFQLCSTLAAVKARHAAEYPEHTRYGIHVMASQNALGEVIIGDSHEYDDAISPFDQPEIDQLILGYLRQMLALPNAAIARRWHGIYAKSRSAPNFTAQPLPGCWIIGSPGGAGMTLSFGLAERWFERAG